MKNKIDRRKFVKTSFAATAGLAMAPGISFNAGMSPYDPKDLPTRTLGKTGLQVPLLGFGCGGKWIRNDEDTALQILEHALNSGVYYWDTAASYGSSSNPSEVRVGKLLKDRRKEVILATKTRERDADRVKQSIERSLKRLQTDYIDIMHAHSIETVRDAETLGDKGNILEVLHDYRDQGIIKHIGFTGHETAVGMKRAAELYDFEVMMIAMNHEIRGSRQEFEEHAVPYAANKGLGVIAMKVVRPRETVRNMDPSILLRYALTPDHFSLANIGTDRMEVLEDNLKTVRNFKPLDKQKMDEVRIALEPFFQHKNLEWMQPGYIDGFSEPGYLA